MTTRIRPEDLHPGDVLLYHGNSLICRLIRLFDRGEYSHASVHDGCQVVESVASGIEARSVEESTNDQVYVDVFRFKATDGSNFGDPTLPADPVLARINHYVQNRQRYAYEQLLLLAILTSTRRIPFYALPGLGQIIRSVLESAADVLANITALGREPMICSELVYRCYEEAGEQYRIRIVGADIEGALVLAAAPVPAAGSSTEDFRIHDEISIVQAEARAFLAKYCLAKGEPIMADTLTVEATSIRANANYVTPHDLQNSESLHRAGRLLLDG